MGFIKNRIDAEYRKHKDINWGLIAEKKIIATILDWCYKNNSIPMKDLFKDLSESKLELCVTDGGWINVLKFKSFLEGK